MVILILNIKKLTRSFRIKKIIYVICVLFIFSNIGVCQTPINLIERDIYYPLNDVLVDGFLDGLDVSIKILPPVPSSGCYTKNTIAFKLEGRLSSSYRFLTFDIIYKNCQNISMIKTFSLPLSENGLRDYLDINEFSSQDYISNILGNNESLNINDHFNFESEILVKIDNVVLTNSYQGGRIRREDQLESPQRINIYNAPGEENSIYDRAEISSNVRLSISGGFIPRGGYWVWYDDDAQRNEIGRGDNITYFTTDSKPEIQFSIVGFDNTGKLKTNPVKRNLYVEVKQASLSKIELLILNDDLDEALDRVNELKMSYINDYDINRMYNRIMDLLKLAEQKQESEALDKILETKHFFSKDFPETDRLIKMEVQSLLNYKIFDDDVYSDNYKLSVDYDYRSDIGFRFSTKKENVINDYLVNGLNAKRKSFSIPRVKYYKDKTTEVYATGNYTLDFQINNRLHKVSKKNGRWKVSDIELLIQIEKNYGVKNFMNMDGTYSVSVKKVTLDNKSYYQTSGVCVKGEDGVHNVLKSAMFSPKGRTNVGLKNSKLITFSIIGLALISTSSKLFSNIQYDKFLNATDQKSLNSYYFNSNLSNKIFLISAGLGITLYSYDLIAVFSKGKKNSKKMQPNKILPSKSDFILLPN